jgi:hypothetical protein
MTPKPGHSRSAPASAPYNLGMEKPLPHGFHGRWLWGLLGLFLLRVIAQPLAAVTGWRWLPPFSAWQSGALPYSVLLASQLVIAGAMAMAAAGVARGRTRPRRGVGRAWAGVAVVYGAVMGARLLLGLTAFRGHWWLDAPLPTVFHLGLTAFLAVYGHYHLRGHAPAPAA